MNNEVNIPPNDLGLISSEWPNRLGKLVKVVSSLQDDIEYNEDSDLGFVLLAFNTKQWTHARSLLLLGERTDALLIGRTMIEGWAYLKYILTDPENLSRRWRAHVVIHDLNTYLYRSEFGAPIEEHKIKSLLEKLRNYGVDFLKPAGLKALERNELPPSGSYKYEWCKEKISKLVTNTHYALMRYYDLSCDWHHWSSGGFGEALAGENDIDSVRSKMRDDFDQTARVATICIVETASALNNHFKLNREQEILEAAL